MAGSGPTLRTAPPRRTRDAHACWGRAGRPRAGMILPIDFACWVLVSRAAPAHPALSLTKRLVSGLIRQSRRYCCPRPPPSRTSSPVTSDVITGRVLTFQFQPPIPAALFLTGGRKTVQHIHNLAKNQPLPSQYQCLPALSETHPAPPYVLPVPRRASSRMQPFPNINKANNVKQRAPLLRNYCKNP